jgi:hypothetical protein
MPFQDWSRIDGPIIVCYEFVSERRFATLAEALHFHAASWSAPRVRYYRDEFGIVIPAWKIAETVMLNPRPNRWVAAWARQHSHVYRQGPVAAIRCHRGRRNYRHIATHSELRENDFLFYDEDAIAHGLKPRGPRRRGNLPTYWDDGQFARRGDGWKQYRRTQYRVN